jgi:N-acetyl-alpha-D-muramate 1-phosphate uridylyltransferase
MRDRTFPLMIFAAGFGTRMGALTQGQPKPLIPVAGRPLIDHALALADALPPGPRVVNLHYRGEMLEHHLAGRDVALSWERPDILDTGGGLRAALPMLGAGPVMTLNSDAVWTGPNPLPRLAAAWDDGRMGALLLLGEPSRLRGRSGPDDFVMDAEGRIARAEGRAGLVYLGAQILNPEGIFDIPDRVFSLNRLWDRLIAQGRAYGLVHDGGWCDVGSPAGIVAAEAMLQEQADVR